MPSHTSRTVLACLLAAAAVAALPAAAQIGGGPEPIPVPDKMRGQNVPEIPASEVAPLLPYENLRGASLQDWHPSERKILVSTRFGETTQIHEVDQPLGLRRQLTFYEERVLGGGYRPGSREIGFAMDEGGAENYQFFMMDRESGAVERVTDGVHRYQAGGFSDDGKWVAYSVNKRNGRDFDVYVMNPSDQASERMVAEVSGAWYPTDWSNDGKKLLATHYISANKTDLYSIDVAAGAATRVTPETEELISWGGGQFATDGRSVYTTTDRGSEFQRLVRIDLASGEVRSLTDDVDWDVQGFDLSDDGRLIFFFVNEDGFSRAHVRDARTGAALPAPELPLGAAFGPSFRRDSHEVGFTLNWARSTSDVYSWDVDAGKLTRWTESEMGGLNPESFVEAELVRYPTFDEVAPGEKRTIPAFVYAPDAESFPPPWPVYVNIHGGPEGQERPTFKGTDSYLTTHLGVAVIYPNVRGSSGYGKSYLQLDNGTKREDSVKDIGALLDWLAADARFDETRVMVGGGSYGGYMSLAAMTFYDDRLCCGFDYVGISSFVTFLENTQGYRQDLRRVEYGDERDPEMRAFLEKISPLTNIGKITKPMLVAQGANDPRVPLSESDQVVAALEANGTPVWYLVAEDEGHGFAKKTNADYLRAVWIRFIKTHLLAPKVDGMEMETGSGG